MRQRIPGLQLISSYERAWLPKDVVAGLVLTALLVPQGMAYAELAGLPAITGLYTTILCLIGYAALGPSRILVLGPDSSLGPMIAATILPLVGADGDPAKAIALASMLALLVGAFAIILGLAKLGFIADLLSKPTQIGYMNGLALTILVGQLPKLFGFSVDSDDFIGDVTGFVKGVVNGETVTAALAIGLFSLALIFHELATNAGKYGAFSSPRGFLQVSWTVDDGRLNVIWDETEGPVVEVLGEPGFGSKLLKSALRPFDGKTEISYLKTGVHCTMQCKLPNC